MMAIPPPTLPCIASSEKNYSVWGEFGVDEIQRPLGYNLRCKRGEFGMTSDAISALLPRKPIFRTLVALCFLLLALAASAAAQSGKRLILKDGSWQQITQYETQGDRTRYFSVVRGGWEEVPNNLVDWEATRRWNSQPMQMPDSETGEASPSGAKGKLTVAPGLQLPARGGVFLLDRFSEHASVVELIQVPGVMKRGRGGILHSGITTSASLKQLLELRGTHARTQAHILLPTLFIKLNTPESAQYLTHGDRFRIVRLEARENVRTVASFDVAVSGNQVQTLDFVPTRVESVGDDQGWLKIVPAQDLVPGEYALLEMLDERQFNTYTWDFGVNPNAPGNLNSRTAYSVPVDETHPHSPELEPREP
jgi:hypothetical protein